jgi:hypothetical protein
MTSTIHAAGKPGRKSETPAQRLARLERDLVAAKRAVKEDARRKSATIGAAVAEEMEGNPEFRAAIRDVLRRRVTTRTGLADIAHLLAD